MECIDTLIGDILPPAELMKTQTDRKIAEELRRTYEVQRESQMKRQDLERETAVANMQNEVVRSEQEVRIAERKADSPWPSPPRVRPTAVRLRAEAEADATGCARRGRGARPPGRWAAPRPRPTTTGSAALGTGAFTAIAGRDRAGRARCKARPRRGGRNGSQRRPGGGLRRTPARRPARERHLADDGRRRFHLAFHDNAGGWKPAHLLERPGDLPDKLFERHRASGRLGPLLAWAVVFADIGTSIYYVPGLLFDGAGRHGRPRRRRRSCWPPGWRSSCWR